MAMPPPPPKPSKKQVTVPSAPVFATEERSAIRIAAKAEAYKIAMERAAAKKRAQEAAQAAMRREAAAKKRPFVPLTPTIPEPFNLASSSRHEASMKAFSELKAKEEEDLKSAAQFKAMAVPSAVTLAAAAAVSSPIRSSTALTNPVTPSFVRRSQEPKSSKVRKSVTSSPKDFTFIAREYKAVKPFEPTPSNFKPTIAEPFKLASEVRAGERAEFDAMVAKRFEEAAAARAESMKLAEIEETNAIAELRASMKPKVLGTNWKTTNAKPFQPVPSKRPLTMPQTPKCARPVNDRARRLAAAKENL